MLPPPTSLRILNGTALPARLRFRCGPFLAWDTWAEAGSVLTVPAMDGKAIVLTAALDDRATGVGYAMAVRLGGDCTRLVASTVLDRGAQRLRLGQEAGGQRGQLDLLNLTPSALQFSLQFVETPFKVTLSVAPQAEAALALACLEVSATVEGITVSSAPIKRWEGDLLIDTVCRDGQDLVQMQFSNVGSALPSPRPLY